MSGITPGPWEARHDPRNGSGEVVANGRVVAGCVWSTVRGDLVSAEALAQARANTDLIAAAPDHALLLAAMCAGKALLVPTTNGVALVYAQTEGVAVTLDAQGCPVIDDRLRAALREAMK